MTVPVDPAIQRRYDAISAEHRAAGAEITAALRARLGEIAERMSPPEPPPDTADDDVVGFHWDE